MTRVALRRHRDAQIPDPGIDRSGLVMGVDKPDATNTGVLPGISRATVNGNVTLGAGGLLKDKNVHGRVITTGANWRIENCLIDGGASTPGQLVECQVAATSGIIIDSEICSTPANMHWNWNGPTGHNFQVIRCNIHHVTDGVGVFKTSANGGGSGVTYNSGVTVTQSWIHDLAWWSAATGGIVHSDTTTHNDGIQIQGGTSTVITGNTIDAYLAQNFAHWWTVGQDLTEPYTFIAQRSLPTAAPYYGGPFQTIPDRGTGAFATGRYNSGASLAAVMVNRNVGNVSATTITDNWINGGKAAINGGLVRVSGEEFGDVLRNKFDRGQGLDNGTPGGDTTYTVLINSSYVGHVNGGVGTGDKNYYVDDNTEVLFRITG